MSTPAATIAAAAATAAATAGSPVVLRTVIFMGSARAVAPVWAPDSDTRLGDRALAYVRRTLEARTGRSGAGAGGVDVRHDVTVFDPLEVFAADGALASSGGELRTPSFYLAADRVPPKMAAMQRAIRDADAFVVVTSEYNHSLPPALTSMMGTFGASNYANKPSAVVTYSSGPWGGARASIAARPFLSELGCLPVSKMVCLPTLAELLNKDGTPVSAESRLMSQLPAMLAQLEWLAVAMKSHRALAGVPAV